MRIPQCRREVARRNSYEFRYRDFNRLNCYELSKSERRRNAAWEECSTTQGRKLQKYLAAQELLHSSKTGSNAVVDGRAANVETVRDKGVRTLLDPKHVTTRGYLMTPMNLCLGWVWITAGLISGAIIGLFFYDPNWLGGYGSWRRRLVRLGHISFLGTGLLNLAFAFTFANGTGLTPPILASWLLAAGAVTMPIVCFLAAWREGFRHLFPIPVASLIVAGLSVVVQGLL